VHQIQAGTAVGQLAVRAVDLAPLFGQLADRFPFPVQQGMQRGVRAGPGIVETARGGAGLPAQHPHMVQAQGGRRAAQRPPPDRDGVLDQGEQAGLDVCVYPRRDQAGG
jgi:hypothetical protein